MKTELTKEQSARLIELGVPKEKASGSVYTLEPDYAYSYAQDFRYYTLTDLLEILSSIEDTELSIHHWMDDSIDVWTAEILEFRDAYSHSDSLIDALYQQTIWCIENGHLKFE